MRYLKLFTTSKSFKYIVSPIFLVTVWPLPPPPPGLPLFSNSHSLQHSKLLNKLKSVKLSTLDICLYKPHVVSTVIYSGIWQAVKSPGIWWKIPGDLSIPCRAVASLTVPGGQEFHFPQFFLNFQSIFLIFPQTLLIFFLTLALRVHREGPGYATDTPVMWHHETGVLKNNRVFFVKYPGILQYPVFMTMHRHRKISLLLLAFRHQKKKKKKKTLLKAYYWCYFKGVLHP